MDNKWLQANKGKPELVILDMQAAQPYQRYHIPVAVNSSYDAWRKKDAKGTVQMMTPPGELGKLIGKLGIDNESHVVPVTTGSTAEWAVDSSLAMEQQIKLVQ
ncbi:MAG: rhodanese-like domain-containing protein [Candidatus Sedimenticola sp. (ex Thyasira tokunagai)]